MTKMSDILDEVGQERLWQMKHWGATHDQGHELEDWLSLIDRRLNKLHNDEALTPIRRRLLLIKVAALAAAAIQALED